MTFIDATRDDFPTPILPPHPPKMEMTMGTGRDEPEV
jgi:hypothetical protein